MKIETYAAARGRLTRKYILAGTWANDAARLINAFVMLVTLTAVSCAASYLFSRDICHGGCAAAEDRGMIFMTSMRAGGVGEIPNRR